jgi:protein ImuA
MSAWENLGIDSRCIVVARVSKPSERLWVFEQGLKSGAFGAIIGWLSQASQQMTRRLQILARATASLVFLFRPQSAQLEPSSAPLRVVLAATQNHALSVWVFKRRGAPGASPLRIMLPQTRTFSSCPEVFPPEVLSLAQSNAVDRSALPGAVA